MGKHSPYAITAMCNLALQQGGDWSWDQYNQRLENERIQYEESIKKAFLAKLIFQLSNLALEEGVSDITTTDLDNCIDTATRSLAYQYRDAQENIETILNIEAPSLINQALIETDLFVLVENAPTEETEEEDLTLVTDVEPQNALLELLLPPGPGLVYDEEQHPVHGQEPPEDDCCIELLCLPSRCCTGICDLLTSMFETQYFIKL